MANAHCADLVSCGSIESHRYQHAAGVHGKQRWILAIDRKELNAPAQFRKGRQSTDGEMAVLDQHLCLTCEQHPCSDVGK
jgi:hypothetical protein